MKRLLFTLCLLSNVTLAGQPYTYEELWRGVPLHRLPLSEMQLVVKCEAAHFEGIPWQQYRVPHQIAVGMRNTGTNTIEEVAVFYSFRHGTMFLRTPANDVLNLRVLPGGFRGIRTWSAIAPGESTFFVSKPLWEWFPAVTNAPDGQFCFWWTIGTNESDRLFLRKAGLEITKEDGNSEPSAGGDGVPPPQP